MSWMTRRSLRPFCCTKSPRGRPHGSNVKGPLLEALVIHRMEDENDHGIAEMEEAADDCDSPSRKSCWLMFNKNLSLERKA